MKNILAGAITIITVFALSSVISVGAVDAGSVSAEEISVNWTENTDTADNDILSETDADTDSVLSEIVINNESVPVTAFTDETGRTAYRDENDHIIYLANDKIVVYGDEFEDGVMMI